MSGQEEKSQSGVAPPSPVVEKLLNMPFAAAPTELTFLDAMIKTVSQRSVYLEIGSFKGASLRRFGSLMDPGAMVVGVDRPIGKPGIAESLEGSVCGLGEAGYKATWVRGDSHSHEIVQTVRELCPIVDVLLIDGDHSAAGAAADVENYVPLVRSGGLVIFHDVGPCTWTRTGSQVVIDACFAAWKSVAQKNLRKMIIQSNAGYGLVWIN